MDLYVCADKGICSVSDNSNLFLNSKRGEEKSKKRDLFNKLNLYAPGENVE